MVVESVSDGTRVDTRGVKNKVTNATFQAKVFAHISLFTGDTAGRSKKHQGGNGCWC